MAPSDRQSDRNRILFATLIAHCWEDEDYRRRFISDPQTVCIEEGILVPDDIELVVKEDTSSLTHVVLPSETSDEALNQFGELLRKFLPLPTGYTLALIQNTEKMNYLVIPLNPRSIKVDLTDADLEALAAGEYTAVNSNIVANHQAVANAVAVSNATIVTTVGALVVGVAFLLYPFSVPAFLRPSPNLELDIL